MDTFDIMQKIDGEILGKDNEEEEKKTNLKLGIGNILDKSVQESVAKANAKYYKPEYNPQTRKTYYDDGKAHKRAIDRAFSEKSTAKDPYTGAELVKKQKDAKAKYGTKWQDHAAEADHIDPLSQFIKRHKNDPFLTTDDAKNIGNSDENFQVISRKSNQNSKDVGKGGSTQKEWASDDKRMEGLAENAESGESIEVIKERIETKGKNAEQRNDSAALKKNVTNAAGTAHQAGIESAKSAGSMALTMAGIMNVVSVIKGEKSSEEAIEDTISVGGSAALSGYIMGGSLTVVNRVLSCSTSEFIKALAASNVPGKIITAVSVTGDTLKKWLGGEITTEECLLQLGDKGLNMLTMAPSIAIGSMIPIPIVGPAIGALVGSMLTSSVYNSFIGELQTKQLEHMQRIRIIAECNAAAEQMQTYRKEMGKYMDLYFREHRQCFDMAISSMQTSYAMGDVEGVIASANEITRKLGGKVTDENREQFRAFLKDDSVDVF